MGSAVLAQYLEHPPDMGDAVPVTSDTLESFLRVHDLPDNEDLLFFLTASPLQPSASVMRQCSADDISPKSVAQRARMTETVPQLRKLGTVKDSMTVVLPWEHDVNAVPGRKDSLLNFLNERYAPFGVDPSQVLYVPVRKTLLQEIGGDPPCLVRVVSSCTLTITFKGHLELDVDFLIFREDGKKCVDMILNVAPYEKAFADKASAATVSANSEAGPRIS